MLFELSNTSAGRVTHCGVMEFIADEGLIYLPYWVSFCNFLIVHKYGGLFLDDVANKLNQLLSSLWSEKMSSKLKFVNMKIIRFFLCWYLSCLSSWFQMMENMLLQEGDIVEVKNASLAKGSYVKLQPHTKDFLDISNPKAVLVYCSVISLSTR